MEELVAEAAPRRERRRRKGGAAAGAGGGSAAARVAYGDVFGGPPRFAAPFAGAPEDYADVFGGVAATCSIPFLDLPRAAGVVVAVGVVDYGEVFGRVDFGGFAVPYEELFAGVEVEREREEIASSSGSSRSSINNEPSQLETKPSVLSQHYPNVDRIQHFEEEQFSPISIPPDGEQRFSMSYNNMAQGGPDDLAGMATCVVEPSIHDMVDPCILSHESSTNHVPRMDNGNGVKGKSFLLSSANTSVRSSESDFMVDQKQHMPKCLPISENVCANEIHQNSGSHSASNDEAPFDYPFLRVSNDGLQTLPIKAPPPSRLPLKLHNTQESTAKGDIHLVNNKGTPASSVQAMSNSNTLQAAKKVDPPLFDPDVNPSPTAAAAAAMKEAMEFADTRLKAAKELMERKGDSFKLGKRSGHHRSTKSTEMKESKTPEEIPTFEEKLSVKKSSNEHKNNEDLALLDKHRNVSAVKLVHCDDNEKRVLPLEKPQQMMQSGIGLCQASSKFEKSGNGRSGDEFYELISHDRKCATNTATEEEGNGGGTSPATELSKDTTRNTGVSAGDSDLERYENLWEDNDSREVGVKHVDLREDSIASMESDDKVPIIPESSVPAENLAHHQEIHGSHFRGKMRAGNIQESHDDDARVARMSEMPSKLDFVQEISGSFSEACSSGEHVNDLRDLGDTSTMGSPVVGTSKEDYSNKEGLEMHCVDETLCTAGRSKNLQGHPEVSTFDDSMASQMKARNLEEPAESYECQASLRESSTADGEAETYEQENFSFVNETCLHNENKKIIEVPTEAPIYNKVEKFGTENTGPCEYSEEIGVDWNAECPEQNDITLENSSLANELEQSEVLNVFEVASKLIERKCGIFEKDPDQLQEKQGLLKPGELQGRTQGAEYIESDSKEKEASLEKSEMPAAEKILDHDGQEDQMASKTDANNEPSGLNAEGNVKIDEEGNALHSGVEVNINTANDYATRMSMNLKDVPTPFSEMYTIMHHLPPNADSVSAQAFDGATPGLQEDCKKGAEREFLTERSTTFQEKKRTGSKMEEKEDKQKTPNVVLKDQKSPRLEKSSNIPKSVEDTASAFVKTSRKEAPVVHKTEERENRSTIERKIEGKEVSRRLEEEKERERKLEKQRERKLEKQRERKLEKQREQAKERERRILEEKEREKEREKDRLAVERATREAHQRAFAEARERAERVALERITAARQRASTEAREKEKARAGAAAEKASREARLKVERAAVERATAEARERAIEKAKAEKAAADARERMERSRPSFRESFKTTNQDTRQDAQSQRTISNDFKRSTNYSNQVEVESTLRYKARLERHQRTAERVTKALAEKNLRDMLAQREQAERHRLAEFLDPEVKRWSNGKEGNLRALLSTLQYILGSDSGWQPVPLTDLITAAAVKKAYRRATLCVHPDKLQQRGATVRQKYVCEKVFDLLKEAWNKFNSEER